MAKQSIKEIEKKLQQLNEKDEFINELMKDDRKGVQAALKKWHRKQDQYNQLIQKYENMMMFEKKYRAEGFKYIAGVDEVGRGPLAGPVVAAAVILPANFYLPGIDDSKKLTERKRNDFYEYILQEAVAFGVGIIEADEIDRINILEASKKAMLSAVAGLDAIPDFLLIDAVKLNTPYPYEALIKGDARSISIAAASIVAKVTRDRLMLKLSEHYPQYRFSKNMGYGTKDHLDALEAFGITSIHRKSFAPVKAYSD
ncbi:ribonuclease HII [Cytobacillus purgationiresistens]|uniref:Ribonuclease HII n=1 Tax=Cytobacillus purgationiresistens TaxID=863449 RepID=A0ABU0AG66_9BACI|nr:ribonuclease HII [Cytobacillus purgationiresistens]MDQ0270248.1 ribonuclease HII [Cytobacillus purgationiresistens]